MKNTKQKNVIFKKSYRQSRRQRFLSCLSLTLHNIISIVEKSDVASFIFPTDNCQWEPNFYFFASKSLIHFFVSLSPSLVICTDESIIAGLTSRGKVTT